MIALLRLAGLACGCSRRPPAGGDVLDASEFARLVLGRPARPPPPSETSPPRRAASAEALAVRPACGITHSMSTTASRSKARRGQHPAAQRPYRNDVAGLKLARTGTGFQMMRVALCFGRVQAWYAAGFREGTALER